MLRSMSGKQFLEWRAYAELEPFDEIRADVRNAHLVQTVRNVLGDKATLTDCLWPFGEEEEAATPPVKDWRAIKAAVEQTRQMLDQRVQAPAPTATAPPPKPRRRRTPPNV